MSDDNIDSMASSVAYAFMLSTFPFLIGVFALMQLLQQSVNIVEFTLNTFNEFFPEAIHNFIMANFNNISYERTGSILIFSIAASIGFGSYGFKVIFIHLSRIMRVEKPRSFIWMSLLSIIFAAGAIVLIAMSFILLLVSNDIVHFIAGRFKIGNLIPTLLNLLRYPVVFISLLISAGIVYRVGPKKKMPWNCILTSSLIFACGWIIATFSFGFYLSKFSKYNLIYGTLAGVIIFLVWMYISAFIFLSAAEIGRIRMDHQRKRDSDSSSGPDTQTSSVPNKTNSH